MKTMIWVIFRLLKIWISLARVSNSKEDRNQADLGWQGTIKDRLQVLSWLPTMMTNLLNQSRVMNRWVRTPLKSQTKTLILMSNPLQVVAGCDGIRLRERTKILGIRRDQSEQQDQLIWETSILLVTRAKASKSCDRQTAIRGTDAANKNNPHQRRKL